MTSETKKIAGRTLAEWQEFARTDNCLDQMVPSDLRQILMAVARAEPRPAPDVAELVEWLRKAALPLSLRQMETNEDGMPTIPGDGEGMEAAEVMERAAEALTRLSADRDAVIEIKELEWKPSRNGDWFAESAVGQYAAGFMDQRYIVVLRRDEDEVIGRSYANHTEAKAAAQSDYETRIRSAMKGEGS